MESQKHPVSVAVCFGVFFLVGGCATAPYRDYYAAKQTYETKAPMVQAIDPKKYEDYRNLFIQMQQEMDMKHWRKAKKLAKKIQALEPGLPDAKLDASQTPVK